MPNIKYKDKSLNLYGWYKYICQILELTCKRDINYKSTEPGYMNGIYAILIRKKKKKTTQIAEGTELPN